MLSRSAVTVLFVGILATLPCLAQSTVDVAARATGGSGTSGSPWTGWDTVSNPWLSNTTYTFKPGYYSAASPLDWGVAGIALIGECTPSAADTGAIIKYSGSSSVPFVKFDAGSGSSIIYGIRMENL